MQKASRLAHISKQVTNTNLLVDAPEEVQNLFRLASLLIDIQLRNRKQKLQQESTPT
ncbi:MAG: hypothetical protein AAB971_00385 [Patescibacteria group bacterium]